MKQLILICLLSLSTPVLFAQGDRNDNGSVNIRTNKVLKSGFFVEGLITGISTKIPSFKYYKGFSRARRATGAGFGFRFGNRFYFGNNTKYRPGMNLNYLRFQIFAAPGVTSIAISPIGVGFANIINFNDVMGLEANFNVMLNFFVPISRSGYGTYNTGDGSEADAYFGTIFGPTVKFRYKVLAVGLDMGFSPLINLDEGSGRGSYTYFGVCVGVKL